MARALRHLAAAALMLVAVEGNRNSESQTMEVDHEGNTFSLEQDETVSRQQATMNRFDSMLQFVRSAHDFEMTSAAAATTDAKLDAMVKEMTDSLREDLGLGGQDGATHPTGGKQSTTEWLGEKVSELGKMNKADLALGVAVWRAKSKIKTTTKRFIKVGRVHMLHPVGSWRPTTWEKTLRRKEAILAAKAEILANGNKLSQEMINTLPALRIMSSVTPFEAATLEYCDWSYILLEGNGRMRGMQLAAAEDPQLQDMEVEVDFFTHDDSNDKEHLGYVHKGLAYLWSMYVQQAFELAPNSDENIKQIKEYYTFKFDLIECRGTFKGLFQGNNPCDGKSTDGQDVQIPTGGLSSLFVARGKELLGKYVTFQVCPKQQVAQVIMKESEVEESCDRCVDREVIVPCTKP